VEDKLQQKKNIEMLQSYTKSVRHNKRLLECQIDFYVDILVKDINVTTAKTRLEKSHTNSFKIFSEPSRPSNSRLDSDMLSPPVSS